MPELHDFKSGTAADQKVVKPAVLSLLSTIPIRYTIYCTVS